MKNGLISILVVVCVIFLGIGLGAAVNHATNSTPSINSTKVGYTLNLVVKMEWYNASVGYAAKYMVLEKNGSLGSSAKINLPASQVIRIDIVSYDQGISPPYLQSYANVKGTISNSMILTAGNSTMNSSLSGSQALQVSSVNCGEITHTFSLGINSTLLNIPVEAGHNVTAYFELNNVGIYDWWCMCPCGEAAMSTPGWMIGEVDIVT